MKRKKRRRRWGRSRILAGILAIVMMITVLPVLPAGDMQVEAAGTKYVKVTGKAMYSYAYQVLALVNAERKAAGVSTLVMDMDLMEAAMERAAENVVYVAATGNISHTRPNGQECFSISAKSYGENLACGQRDAKEAVEAWMNSTMGHRENLLGKGYTCIGIGCIMVDDIMYLYWTQEFGYSSTPRTGKKPKDAKKTYTIPVKAGMYTSLNDALGYEGIITVIKAGWVKNSKGWRYRKANGTYVKKSWKKLSGSKCYLNASGYRVTGKKKIGGKWYYFNKNGVMKTGWVKLSGKKYYFRSNGVMATGTLKIDGKKYRFSSSGVCLNP